MKHYQEPLELRLRSSTAMIPMTGAVQLRAGDEDILVIESESPDVILQLLRSLQKGCQLEDLLALVESEVHEDITVLLDRLAKEGFLLASDFPHDRDEISRYLSNYPAWQQGAQVGHTQKRILVFAPTTSARLMTDALREYGIEVANAGDGQPAQRLAEYGPTVTVCIWESPNLSTAVNVNTEVCKLGIPCLFVNLSHGRHATVGPFYIPNEGACYECFQRRWRENTVAVSEFDAAERAERDPAVKLPSYGMLPGFRYQVVGLSCSELFAFLTGHRPVRTLNRIATVDLEGARSWTESCWQIPWCPACGVER